MDKPFAIFDMDGTLIDSMIFWKNLAVEYLSSKGVKEIPAEILAQPKRPKQKTEHIARFFHCDLIELDEVVCFEIVNVVVVEFYAVGVSAE